MARPTIRFVVLAAIGLTVGGIAAAVARLRHSDSVFITGEELMAKFEGLDADIDELKAEVAAAAKRVEDAFARMNDDAADQEEVEQARLEVRSAIDGLKALAPAAPETGGPQEPVT